MRSPLQFLATLWRQLIPSGSLMNQTVKSGLWATITNVFGRGLSVIALVFLARLLDPSDFGLMGIALITLTGLKRLSNLGFRTALIQKRDENVDQYLNTMWGLQILRGLVLMGILYGAAPFVASFFGEPRATPILQVISVTPLLLGLRNPGIVYFQKDLEFHKEFIYKSGSSLGRFVVSIGWALVSPSIWALVAGFVVSDLLRLVFSFLLHDYRPRPRFDMEQARELFGYGKWITASGILQYVFSQGDDAFVGWLLTATSLGFYQVAYQLASAPATEITQVISNVMLSLYSKLQDDLEELRQAFLRTMRLVTLVSAPMGVGILTVAPEFVVGVMGEQWTPMITTMQILAIFGLVRAFGATYGPVFMAVGRPDITTKLLSLNIVLLAIFIYPAAVAHGIEGVAMATLGALVVKVLVGGYVMSRVLETGVLKVFSPLLYPVVASSVMGALVVSTGAWFPLQSAVLEFVVLVAVGGASYVASVLLIDRLFKWGITSEVVTVFRSATG